MTRTFRSRLAAMLMTTVAAAGLTACGSESEEPAADGTTPVNLIMEWPVADAFWTPFVVAKDKGYYSQAGMDVTITPPPTVADTMKFLGTAEADMAFTTTLDVLFAKDQDAPVIATGAYGDQNNWGLIAREPFELADIKGKTIGIYNDAWSKAQLTMMLNSVGLALPDVQLVTAADNTVPLLLENRVDIITGVTNAESADVRVNGGFDPFFMAASDHGAPNAPIFVVAGNTEWLEQNTDTAKAFMLATKRGLDDALNDPEGAMAIFDKTYPGSDMGFIVDSWNATAEILKAQVPPFEQSDEQWSGLLDAAVAQDLVKSVDEPSAYWTNDYLPE
ncbi:ABC transporter substrate-binding protein [Mycolicibacterium baixiangningiae]|uniref:ABC transporter substrate-binding protein n=1 Tax=Mycolicibacterium baixiangningiae TaxID=2761578 RepID=UPI0018686D44|nr:ABC transporter substrate-binding protein [Mycolicibacterium baixiangningiae]